MFEDEFANWPIETPRRVDTLPGLRLSGSISKVAVLFPLLFVGFFITIPLTILHGDPALRLARGPSESAQARVLSNTNTAACRDEAAHRITYSFATPSGREYRGGTTLCPDSPYFSANAGDTIEVKYLTGEPAVNALQGGREQAPPPLFVFLLMPLFCIAIFASLYWPPVREVLRARRLFKNGRLVVGRVIFVKQRPAGSWPGMPSMSASEVYVRFPTALKPNQDGVASCRNDWLLNQMAPGASVHLAYSDDDPGQVALLDAYLR